MTRTALVIDDSASMRQMVTITLSEAGFTTLEGADGQQGLSALGRAGKVDLITTDLNMPVMDGITFIRQARQLPICKFTPILMLTTESQEARKLEGKAAGATGWLVKPFDPEKLLQVIGTVVR